MTVATMPEQTWTAASIDYALVKIRTALTSLQRGRCDSIDRENETKARELLLYLEQNRTACTNEARDLCRQLLSRCVA